MEFSTFSGLLTKQFSSVSDSDCLEYVVRALHYVATKTNGLSCEYVTAEPPSVASQTSHSEYRIVVPIEGGMMLRSIDGVYVNGISVLKFAGDVRRETACRRYFTAQDNVVTLHTSYDIKDAAVRITYTCDIDLESPPCRISAGISNKYFEAILSKAMSLAAFRIGEMKLSASMALDADRHIRTALSRSSGASTARYATNLGSWVDRR